MNEELAMKYEMIIFDLDGTLVNSFPFFVSVFNKLADKHKFKKVDKKAIEELRHLSALKVMQYVGVPIWKLPMIANDFKSMMKANASNIHPFEEVDFVISRLYASGVVLALVSSNSTENVRLTLGLENFSLFEHYECGMSIFGKETRIAKVIRKAEIAPNKVLYIGDQITDIEAAKEAKVAFGAVAWGYGTLESLIEFNPAEKFYKVTDILKLISS